MRLKILEGKPPVWTVHDDALAILHVNTCKRCLRDFDTPIKERSYCTDKCQFATWNDNKILNRTDGSTVKTPNRS